VKKILTLVLLAAMVLCSYQPAPAQDKMLSFNYGTPTADEGTLWVAEKLDLFHKVGLDPHFYYFQSGAPLLAALKSGSVDVVQGGLGFAFALGQGIPMKIFLWGTNNAAGEGLVVNPKSGIKSYKDIAKASKIGAASGTCAQTSLYMIAQKEHLDYSKLNVVNIAAPLFHNAFVSNSIDAGISWLPYSQQLQQDGFPVVSYDQDYSPPGGLCPGMIAARPDFLAQHPDIAQKLLQVEQLAKQALGHDLQVGIDAYVERLHVTPEVAKATLMRECFLQYEKWCKKDAIHVPSFPEQLDEHSPYSLTSRTGGLVGMLYQAGQILAAVHTIPQPIPLKAIQDAVDPSVLQAYMSTHKNEQ
jgi:ABC-type nitrate/sulfonate/bicarbonate transport system substrate-binding protein